MGQCYSVTLTVKVKDEVEFVMRSGLYIQSQNIRKDCFKGADMTTPQGNIRFVLAGNTQPGDYSVDFNCPGVGWRKYRNAFDASYSWDGLLDEWFRAVAPALEVGSEIEVWPDHGHWTLRVEHDGKITSTVVEEDDEEEYDEI